jgi:mono/diheme cytochrome c family protein
MKTRLNLAALIFASLLFASGAAARPAQRIDQDQLPADFVPSGKQMFTQYCAACHGADAKGNGPARAALKVPAANLTTLAKRHGGSFPYDYVTKVLQFGPGFATHGSSDMPTWGPIFRYMDNYNNAAVEKRIKNLCDYLNSLQQK